MNIREEKKEQRLLRTHAVNLAAAHAEDEGERCRRWRRRAAIRRCLCMVVMLTTALFVAESVFSAVGNGPQATGSATTDEAVAAVQETLMKL